MFWMSDGFRVATSARLAISQQSPTSPWWTSRYDGPLAPKSEPLTGL